MSAETASLDNERLIRLSAGIVSAYVQRNTVQAADLAELIKSVHETLTRLAAAPKAEHVPALAPPVPVRKTITPDYLISLEDGKRYKTLKRHLSGRGLTPAEYRAKWSLPADYPMVAPNYARRRSELARQAGLGARSGMGKPDPTA